MAGSDNGTACSGRRTLLGPRCRKHREPSLQPDDPSGTSASGHGCVGVVSVGRGRLERGANEAGSAVIKIAITEAAFEAIASTLPLGSVAVEPELDAKGERHIWLGPTVPGFTRRPSGLAAIQARPAPRTDPARPGYPSAAHATIRRAENPRAAGRRAPRTARRSRHGNRHR